MTSERAYTAGLARFFGSAKDVRVSIGDDAAVVANRGAESVLCCDPVVAGVHFALDEDLALVGRKAVNRNLADLAAMGAEPDWLLVSLVLPGDLGAGQRDRLMRGIRAAARVAGASVVGGDVATSPGPLVVTVTAVGHLPGRPLCRDAARAGDAIHLTGPVGGSSDGHHLRFRPPLSEGVWLASAASPVTAAIDVSDGVLLDLQTLLAASSPGAGSAAGLGAELFVERLPLRAVVLRQAEGDRLRAVERAVVDGEDHVLLFTVAEGAELPDGGPLRARARRPVGKVLDEPGVWLVDKAGRRRAVSEEGYQHALAD